MCVCVCVCVGGGAVRTCTVRISARPGESVLTHSGSTALQLVATGAFEITSGPVVVSVTVALHVTVVWRKQFTAAAHCKEREGGT